MLKTQTQSIRVTMSAIAVAVLLFCTGLAISSNETRLEEIATFVAEVITNFTIQRAGIVELWLYTAEGNPQPDNLLERIQQRPTVRNISRMLFRQTFPEHGHRNPTLLVMDLRAAQTNSRKIPNMRKAFLPLETHFIILVNQSEIYYIRHILGAFYHLGLLNVFYLHTGISQSFYLNPYDEDNVEFFQTFPIETFPDHVRNVNGYHLKISQVESTPNAYFQVGKKSRKSRKSMGPAVDWVNITAQYMNATFSIIEVKCDPLNCGSKRGTMPNGKQYDLNIDVNYIHPIYIHFSVRSVYPASYGIVAPRGHKIEIHEIFWLPFEKEIWIIIVLVLITSALLMQLFPNHFQNNLFLLALCSFEKVPLYRVQHLERTVAITLVIFFFLLLSAYESLFISLMTNRPRLHNPRTVQDLVKAGFKLPWKATYKINEELRELADYVDDFDVHYTFNELTARYGEHTNMRLMMNRPENFDLEAGESRYVKLDYSYWKGNKYYVFKMVHPLIPKFRYTQTVLNEAGFFEKFTDYHEYQHYKSRNKQILVRRFVASNPELDIEQMSPAWIVLALGWIISVFGFISEWCWFHCRNFYIKKKNNKGKGGKISNDHEIQIEEME